jgi:plasmid stabilization system protein ParE
VPRIELSNKADSDLEAIHENYAGLIGYERADAVIATIIEAFKKLAVFPGMGRPSQTPDVRELVMTRYPFVITYAVRAETVFIVRILHERNERFSTPRIPDPS